MVTKRGVISEIFQNIFNFTLLFHKDDICIVGDYFQAHCLIIIWLFCDKMLNRHENGLSPIACVRSAQNLRVTEITSVLTELTHGITPIYTTEDFLCAAARVESLSSADCDPALFKYRERYASDLRRMAPKPCSPSHVNAMNKLFIFDHSARRQVA